MEKIKQLEDYIEENKDTLSEDILMRLIDRLNRMKLDLESE